MLSASVSLLTSSDSRSTISNRHYGRMSMTGNIRTYSMMFVAFNWSNSRLKFWCEKAKPSHENFDQNLGPPMNYRNCPLKLSRGVPVFPLSFSKFSLPFFLRFVSWNIHHCVSWEKNHITSYMITKGINRS